IASSSQRRIGLSNPTLEGAHVPATIQVAISSLVYSSCFWYLSRSSTNTSKSTPSDKKKPACVRTIQYDKVIRVQARMLPRKIPTPHDRKRHTVVFHNFGRSKPRRASSAAKTGPR